MIEKISMKIILVGAVVFSLYRIADNLLTKTVNDEDRILIEGFFKEAYYDSRTGGINYTIRLLEDTIKYQVRPESSDCFDYASFKENVGQGDNIEVYIRKDNGPLKSSKIATVVSVVKGGVNYLPLDCINEEIKSNKAGFEVILYSCLLVVMLLVSRLKISTNA